MANFRPSMFALTLLGAMIGLGHASPLQAHQGPPHESSDTKAAEPPAARPWSTLDPAQRDMLKPLHQRWDSMSPRKQAHMLKRVEHWTTLPPEKREEISARIARWQSMTPEQRRLSRSNRHEFQQLPPADKDRLRAAYQRFQHLPPAQRDALIQQWRDMPVSKRLQWVSSPAGAKPAPASSTGHP